VSGAAGAAFSRFRVGTSSRLAIASLKTGISIGATTSIERDEMIIGQAGRELETTAAPAGEWRGMGEGV
jgi:hypothetical protein